jgi:hypothetical protein
MSGSEFAADQQTAAAFLLSSVVASSIAPVAIRGIVRRKYPAALVAQRASVGLKPTGQRKDDEDDQDDADDANASMTVTISVAAKAPAEPAKQEYDEDDDEYESNRHELPPIAMDSRTSRHQARCSNCPPSLVIRNSQVAGAGETLRLAGR